MNNIPQLKDIIQEDLQEGNRLKIMTSRFTLFAYKEIQEELSKVSSVELIINPNKYDSSDKFIETLEESSFKINLDYTGIAREFATWLEEKVNIRRVKSRKIEGKMLSVASLDRNRDISSKYRTYPHIDEKGTFRTTTILTMKLKTIIKKCSGHKKVVLIAISLLMQVMTISCNKEIEVEHNLNFENHYFEKINSALLDNLIIYESFESGTSFLHDTPVVSGVYNVCFYTESKLIISGNIHIVERFRNVIISLLQDGSIKIK